MSRVLRRCLGAIPPQERPVAASMPTEPDDSSFLHPSRRSKALCAAMLLSGGRGGEDSASVPRVVSGQFLVPGPFPAVFWSRSVTVWRVAGSRLRVGGQTWSASADFWRWLVFLMGGAVLVVFHPLRRPCCGGVVVNWWSSSARIRLWITVNFVL
ncbi:hypothetical protein BRADI_3g20674v3 [Brachypodium distachyon]|uniref:Uncharacterized protein n=1 Tax=Brachypodium distachyon TaxID=15368 RepID=A0A2K2CYJ0_BRADI|nr:hypothetical protein BRADI_3g20674v3 [Brachypodium distachyon]